MDNFNKARYLKFIAYQDHVVLLLDSHCPGGQNNNKRRHNTEMSNQQIQGERLWIRWLWEIQLKSLEFRDDLGKKKKKKTPEFKWNKVISTMLICQEIRMVIGRTDPEAENPILWPPDAKRWLIRKDPVAGKDWRQDVKQTTEDEIVGWHHWLNGHESEQAPGDGEGQGSLTCCRPRGHKETRMSEWTAARTRMVKVHGFPPICDTAFSE